MQVEEAALRRTVSKNLAAYRYGEAVRTFPRRAGAMLKDTIKKLRIQQGLSQDELAERVHVVRQTISKWERGESLPDIYILTRIADLYGITVSNLIGEEEPPKEDRPRFHMFILILSIALTFAVATLIFFLFVVFAIPYRAWLFFIYAIPVASILAIVFTSLWWGLLWQGISTSLLVWSLGLSLYLSLPVPNLELIFLVCAAAQVLVILWELFRRSLAKK